MKPFGVTLLILLASLTDVKGDSCGHPPTNITLGCYGTIDFCIAGADSEYTSRDNYQDGDSVPFICKPGYWISATQSRSTETKCQHDGTWSKPYIECEEIICQLPDQGEWKKKQKIQDFFDYSYDDPYFSEFDEVIVRCPENSTMVGGEEGMLNLCQEGGTWEKPFPQCAADCNCPVNTRSQCKETTERQVRRNWRYITEQHVTWADCTPRFLHGEERKVKCSDSRFELQDGLDEMLVKCYDGDLDNEPTCTPKQCSVLRAAHVRTDTWEVPVKHGDTLHYQCEAGYEARHSNGVKCENEEMQQPVCDPKSCAVCTRCKFDNWERRDHRDKWSVKCQTSFRKTINQVTCQLGDWKDEDGKTVVEPCTDTCPKPTLTNGDINGATLPNSYTLGSFPAAPDSRLLYSCAEGYQKDYPNRDIKCIAASFSPTPSCIKNPCPICDGCVLDTALPSGRSWQVRCLNGWMKEEGQDVATCENSAWNPRQPCKTFGSVPRIQEHRVFLNESIKINDGLEVPVENGFRFSGNGYVVMPKDRLDPKTRTTVALNFSTFAENGLLVLMGDNAASFLSVELKDGRILFKYDLGSGASEIITEEGIKFNDGKWHSMTAMRIKENGMVRLDGGKYFASDKSLGLQKSLDITDQIHVGGYKGTHKYPGVTSTPFRGCIKDLVLGGSGSDTERDMNNNLFAYNVQPGCVETARSVSFEDMGSDDSYIAMSNFDSAGNTISVDGNYEMTMKFKSENEDGLIFYISDDQQSQQNALSVSISKGKVNSIFTVEGVRTVLESTDDQYNDGRWHYIRVSKKNRGVQLDIDDQESISDSYEGRRKMATTSYLYFGGLPFRPLDTNVGSIVSYVGCIGDVTINGDDYMLPVNSYTYVEPTNYRYREFMDIRC